MPSKTPPTSKKPGAGSAKPTSPKSTLNKSDFVRSHPNMPASEVVRRGEKQGLQITQSLVYNVRAAERKKEAKGESQAAAEFVPTAFEDSPLLERQFNTVVVRLGLDRSKVLLADLERTLAMAMGDPTVAKRKLSNGSNVSRSSPGASAAPGTPSETKHPAATG